MNFPGSSSSLPGIDRAATSSPPSGRAYYNENDREAAEWLRELIAAGLIADGDVDERSILDVRPVDLAGYTQCHFFAGIGGWSYALRLAGWPDNAPVWTGSPPCQPFSSAGLGNGPEDERHLAPHFCDLVGACRPGVLFGEQVASAAVFGKAAKRTRSAVAHQPEWAWLDDLSDRLEAAQYAVGASDIPAAGVGAPQLRQRTFFGAVDIRSATAWLSDGPTSGRIKERAFDQGISARNAAERRAAGRDASGEPCQLADSRSIPSERNAGAIPPSQAEQHRARQLDGCGFDGYCNGGEDRQLADTNGRDASAEREQRGGEQRLHAEGRGPVGLVNRIEPGLEGHGGNEHGRGEPGRLDPLTDGSAWPAGATDDGRPGPTNGFWRDADWLLCRDECWRPVEPGTFPLADGLSSRVGLLRGYGNAICPWAAAAFVTSFSEAAA